MAVVRLKATGRYAAVVNYLDDTGKRRQLRRNARTRNEAKRLEGDLIRQRDEGVIVASDRVTVRHFLNRWIATKKTDLRPGGHAVYANLISHVSGTIGDIGIARLKPLQIVTMQSVLRARLSQKTVSMIHHMLKSALQDALKWGVIGSNPMVLVDAPKVERPPRHVITIDELRSIFAAADKTSIGPLVRVAAWTGMRIGELLALRWSDIDGAHVSVTASMDRFNNRAEAKTARSNRRLTISAETIAVIGCLPRDAAGPFPFLSTSVRRVWSQIRADIGLDPGIRFHDLRHAHASHMLHAGMTVTAVSERLGHANASTTLNIYAHSLPDADKELAAAIDTVMR